MGTIVKNRHRKQAETWQIHILLTTKVKVAKSTVGIGPNKALSELHCACPTRMCLSSRILSLFTWLYEKKNMQAK